MPLCFSKRSLKKIQKIQKIGEVSGEDSTRYTHTPSRKGQEEKHRYFNVRRSPTPQLLSPARTKVAPLVAPLASCQIYCTCASLRYGEGCQAKQVRLLLWSGKSNCDLTTCLVRQRSFCTVHGP